MKVLFVLFRSLGDVCMGTTVIRALKEKNPNYIIDVMTEKQNVETLQGNPDVNEIIVGDNYMFANIYFMENHYDKIFKVNMLNQLESCWHHLPESQNQHLVEWYAKKCGIDNLRDKNIYIYPTNADYEIADFYFNKLKNEKLIAFHTTSGSHRIEGTDKFNRVQSKDWPIDYFEVIAERLLRNGYNVCQVGSESDEKIQIEGVQNLLGKLSFKQCAPFFKKCLGYLGVDSGPAYLAGWSGIPSLLIMGSTQNQGKSNFNSGPSVGPRDNNVFYINPVRPQNENCSPVPCYNHCAIGHNGGRGCIQDITTDVVYEKFIKIMTQVDNKKELIKERYESLGVKLSIE